MKARILYLSKRLITRLSVSPIRVVAYLLHATGLEHIYKPRFIRNSTLLTLSDEVVAKLPKYSQTMTGGRMDPMNIIFVGSELDIKLAFKAAGWASAHPASPIHLLYSGLTVVFGKTHATGPFSPHFVNIGLQDMAFQKLTRLKSFKQRHHIRIWKTGIELPGKSRVWVGAASFDDKLKIQFTPPWIHHHLDPNLDLERDKIVRALESCGAVRLKSVVMNEPVLAGFQVENSTGNRYFTDGRAVVIEL